MGIKLVNECTRKEIFYLSVLFLSKFYLSVHLFLIQKSPEERLNSEVTKNEGILKEVCTGDNVLERKEGV